MAGRIRTVKPELISTERFARLSDAAARLYYGLLALVDDDGNCPAGPAFLAGQIFYARPRSVVSIGKLLAELDAAGWVRKYVAEGAPYVGIVAWGEKGSITYQKIDRPQPARFPGPRPNHSTNVFDDGSGSPISDLRSPKERENDTPKKSTEADPETERVRGEAVRVLSKLDKLLHTTFATTEESIALTMNALCAGYDEGLLSRVVKHKVESWGNDAKMAQHLTPRVLFGERVAQYVAAATAVPYNNRGLG